MVLVSHSEAANKEVSSMPSSLAMEGALPAYPDRVDKDEERGCDSCARYGRGTECDLLTQMDVKGALYHWSTKRAQCTVQGARQHAVAVSRDAGRLLMYRLLPPMVAGSTVVRARNAAERRQDAPVGPYSVALAADVF
ncbi:uncharacterized protein LOC142570148 [Dermacentor variabilis]|uniref:uncharacterized protein LOC142570148 n=1 Tax=Dermacentor variabilis TaxID=34621 RepID=UPI003F5B7A21